MSDGVPEQSFIHCFILMAIYVPRRGDSRPIDLRVPLEQLIGKPPRRFRDDLQCPHYRINRLSFHTKSLEVELSGKSSDRIDVVFDVGKALSRILRRHEPCRAECWL